MINRVAIFLLAALLISCKVDTGEILSSNETLKVTIYSGGAPIEEYFLTPSDDEYKKFKSWVKSNQSGWNFTLATYVPNLLVSGESFSCNFMSSSVVLNYEGGQFTKDINSEDYEFLQK